MPRSFDTSEKKVLNYRSKFIRSRVGGIIARTASSWPRNYEFRSVSLLAGRGIR